MMLEINSIYDGYYVKSFLGSGKAGESYLVLRHSKEYVLKIMHHRPFINGHVFTIDDEIHAFSLLTKLNIRIPKLFAYHRAKKYLVKEYIQGDSVAKFISNQFIPLSQYYLMHYYFKLLESKGYTIDYFPTNFIMSNDQIWYVDYEINPYDDMWSFESWGIYYWFNQKGFNHYFAQNNSLAMLNQDDFSGKPIKSGLEASILDFMKSAKSLDLSYIMSLLRFDPYETELFSIKHGMAALSYRVKNHTRDYFIKLYPTNYPLSDIKSEIMGNENNTRYSPQLIYTDLSLKHINYYLLVFEYIDGQLMIDRYHQAVGRYKLDLIQDFSHTLVDIHSKKANCLTYDFVNQVIIEIKDKAKNSFIDLDVVIVYLEKHKRTLTQLKCCILHGDYHPWNIINYKDKVIVIDWKSKVGDYRFDVYWTYTLLRRSGYKEFADSFLSSYAKIKPEVLEDQAFFIVLSSTSWLLSVLSSPSKNDKNTYQVKSLIDNYYQEINKIINDYKIKEEQYGALSVL
ncbi:MAG: aminoglycoside phosphotransferase family protein [Acholeplasmataceae bacterium]|nr:aminoglycoside phosphotransferase family protein [Acholeplasmataceae bacterium]